MLLVPRLKETPDANGLTPLMLAVNKENMFMIQVMIIPVAQRNFKKEGIYKTSVVHFSVADGEKCHA